MRVVEGRGFLLRYHPDTPYSGWIPARLLDARTPILATPWLALQSLAELAGLFPGGLALLWDLRSSVAHEPRPPFCQLAGHLPNVSLHVKATEPDGCLEGPLNGWFHGPEPPRGAMGLAWRQGWIGWVPEPTPGWSLPGLGRAEGTEEAPEETLPGCHWGELILPLGALNELRANEVAPMLAEIQAGIERNLSLRISARAWPEVFPFQRRRTGWRIAVLGGREYRASSGTWEAAAERLQALAGELSGILKCPVQTGTSDDPEAASLLGHQAMREGHPWRYSLPLPPASPTFTPGLGADPRSASPLESRAAYPEPLAAVLSHAPAVALRLPNTPQESAVEAFLRGLTSIPAIRWLPPGVPPPGPFSQERPWAAASSFTPLMDVTQTLQPGLFEETDPMQGDPGSPRNE